MAASEQPAAQNLDHGHSREVRSALRASIEFIGDFDVIEADAVDISEGGICFDTAEPLTFEMRFEADGGTRQERAQLVWVERLANGGHRCGFQFVEAEDETPL